MTIKTLRPGDPDFHIIDGMIMSSRASIEISQQCPSNYARMVVECINYGWIKPVAQMKESEYVWEKLGG